MAYYYVKNGGTATGDAGRYASQQTGAFSGLGTSGYYDTIADAFAATTAPAAGDFVLVSDIHSVDPGASVVFSGSTSGAYIYIVCVSDTAIDSSSTGANETHTNDNRDWSMDGQLFVHGITLFTTDDFVHGNGASIIYNECDIGVGGSNNDQFFFNGDGTSVAMINSTLRVDGNARMFFRGGSTLSMFGGSVAKDTSGDFIIGNFNNGGGTMYFEGVDISDVDGYLVSGVGSDLTNDDLIQMHLSGCALNASLTDYFEEAIARVNNYIKVVNSSATSAAAEYQVYEKNYCGEIEDQVDSGIHRDESTAFPGGEKVSLKVTTNTKAAQQSPLWFEYLAVPADLATASSDTITIYFASTTSLTDNDVWAELIYPDGTNKNVWNHVSNRNADILSAGTAHTDDSGSSTWLDGASALVGYNEYRMTITTTGDAGADSVPVLRIYCGIASTTIYFDTTVDLG